MRTFSLTVLGLLALPITFALTDNEFSDAALKLSADYSSTHYGMLNCLPFEMRRADYPEECKKFEDLIEDPLDDKVFRFYSSSSSTILEDWGRFVGMYCRAYTVQGVREQWMECLRSMCSKPEQAADLEKAEERRNKIMDMFWDRCPLLVYHYSSALKKGITVSETMAFMSTLTVTEATTTRMSETIVTGLSSRRMRQTDVPEEYWDFTTRFGAAAVTDGGSPTPTGDRRGPEETIQKEDGKGAEETKGSGESGATAVIVSRVAVFGSAIAVLVAMLLTRGL